MDMPCNCPECGEVVELNDMVHSPSDDKTMVCEECHEIIELEMNSGIEIDYFGNKISWSFDSDSWLMSFYLNGVEITSRSIECEKEDALSDFMKTWNLAQRSKPQK